MRLVFALALAASPAIAEPHYMTTAMKDQPCGTSLATINAPKGGLKGAGEMAMAFGYLLGFQAAKGGDISGDAATVLKRVTSDCEANPDRTVLQILSGY